MTITGKIESVIGKVPRYFSDNTLDFAGDRDYSPPIYNVWSFAKKSNEVSHFGNSEQRIVDNLLYLYTEPFDIFVF